MIGICPIQKLKFGILTGTNYFFKLINLYQFRPEVQLESEAKFEDLVNPTRFTVAIYHPT